MAILLMFIIFAVISLIFPGLLKLSKLLQQYNDSALTFESDCSTETYTKAKEREHSRKHEQATCVPITLYIYIYIFMVP